jgi:hypothetical protein
MEAHEYYRETSVSYKKKEKQLSFGFIIDRLLGNTIEFEVVLTLIGRRVNSAN